MIKRATQLVGWIMQTFKSREKEVMLTLWKSLVLPHLDYCSQLWNPLEQIQRSFTRQINGLKNIDYWKRLKILKLYSLQRHRKKCNISEYLIDCEFLIIIVLNGKNNHNNRFDNYISTFFLIWTIQYFFNKFNDFAFNTMYDKPVYGNFWL